MQLSPPHDWKDKITKWYPSHNLSLIITENNWHQFFSKSAVVISLSGGASETHTSSLIWTGFLLFAPRLVDQAKNTNFNALFRDYKQIYSMQVNDDNQLKTNNSRKPMHVIPSPNVSQIFTMITVWNMLLSSNEWISGIFDSLQTILIDRQTMWKGL